MAKRKGDFLKLKKGRSTIFGHLRANFLTGLVIVAPVALTIYFVWTAIGIIDSWILPLIPDRYVELFSTEVNLGFNIRGFGLIIFLVFTLLVGYFMKGLIGRTMLKWGERLIDRTPVVRTVYNALKHIAETVINQSSNSFEKACLIEYPRKGVWAIAFIARPTKGEIKAKFKGKDNLIGLFVPTTPNPTSGFFLMVPESEIVILDMTLEDAVKLVISAGLVYPMNYQHQISADTTKHPAESQSSPHK